MVKVGIIGHKGEVGKALVEILNKHPYAEVVYTDSKSDPNKIPLSESEAELFFLALPQGKSKNYLDSINGKTRVIDLSIDHRNSNEWVYGLPELNKDKIKDAQKVANPGCYATAVLEALLPIKKVVNNIHIKTYSGVSGRSGQQVIEDGGIEGYAKGREHKQVPEIEKCLGKQIESLETNIVYPLWTGLVAKIEARLEGDSSEIDFLYKNLFCNETFLELVNFQPVKEINLESLKERFNKVENTNFCYISYGVDEKGVTIISVLDNLIKGGAGQAVQNMNIMYGFDEKEGLI